MVVVMVPRLPRPSVASERSQPPFGLRRRGFIGGLSAALAVPASAAGAQQANRPFRVGVMNSTTAEINEGLLSALRDGLAARGFVEGRQIFFDATYAEGRFDEVPHLARALVARRPDVIVTYTTITTLAVAGATNTIPIVMTLGNDPVAAGLTATLARPSRNVTGFTHLSEVLAPKRLEYLLQVAPRSRRIALVYGDASGIILRDATEPAARALGIALIGIDVAGGIEPALTGAMAQPFDAMIVNADPVTFPATGDIAEFAAARRIPAIFALRQMAVDGGLMALSYDPFENVRGTADYVARILRGTPVASLPFQLPSRLIFTLNLQAARRSLIEIPAAIVALADEVIE